MSHNVFMSIRSLQGPRDIAMGRLAIWLFGIFGGLLAGAFVAAASDVTVTFEESIPTPQNVRFQYCSSPGTNKGVDFNFTRILAPPLSTSSPTHAMTRVSNDDVEPGKG